MPRRALRRLCGWLALAMLVMQWATASYACPVRTDIAAVEAAAPMPDMPGCDSALSPAMDLAQPLLCKAHCVADAQAAQAAAADLPPPVPLLWAVLDWRATAARPTLGAHAWAAPPAPPDPAGAPPIYLVFRVLRD